MIHLKSKKTFGLIASIFLTGYACFAQQPVSDPAKDIEALKQGQEDIRKELQEIKQLLLSLKAPAGGPAEVNIRDVEFELTNNLISGNENAKLVLVEFTDYQ